MKLPTKSVERRLLSSGCGGIIGVDEVGMGCLAGPLVICAALFQPAFFSGRWKQFRYLRDSKLLQAHQRELFARELIAHPLVRSVTAVVEPEEIDRLSIWHAARTGMQRAVQELGESDAVVLVDGPHRIPGIVLEQRPIVRGDRKVFAIAAASVIAKVYRDGLMVRYAQQYPGYGFEIHKGYGTPQHRAQLTLLGSSPIHRHSFAPVRAVLER